MFRLPVTENALPDGCSREQPLHLEGIKKADFRQLLRYMNTRLAVAGKSGTTWLT
jgi:hypothetical protein